MSIKPICYYCHARLTKTGHRRLTWDHKIPKSKGGKNTPDNIVTACFICNQEKGTMSEEQFKTLLKQRMRSMLGLIETSEPVIEKVTSKFWDPRVVPELTLEDYKFLYEVGVEY